MKHDRIETGGEFPSAKQLAALGHLAFVFLRGSQDRPWYLRDIRASLEPAIDTGHFAVLNHDQVPRAFVSWAYMSDEAEARFLRGERLSTQDWMSGDRLWLMDLVAPYGQGSAARMVKAWHEGIPEGTDHYNVIRRTRKPNQARHFLGSRLPNGRWGSRLVGLVEIPKPNELRKGASQ